MKTNSDEWEDVVSGGLNWKLYPVISDTQPSVETAHTLCRDRLPHAVYSSFEARGIERLVHCKEKVREI